MREHIEVLNKIKSEYVAKCSDCGDCGDCDDKRICFDFSAIQALNLAIKALEQERSEIIRCKNCRYDNNCEIQCSAQAGSKFFCGLAERREEWQNI